MSERDAYQAGVPCWVDTLQADPRAAMAFYGARVRLGGGGRRPRRVLRGPSARPRRRPGSRSKPEDAAARRAGSRTSTSTAPTRAPPRRAARAARCSPSRSTSRPPAAWPCSPTPSGAVFCLWEPGTRQGAQLVNEPGAWAMSMLRTPDPEAAAAFYGELFGWTTEEFGPFTMFRLPGYVGGEPSQPVSREVIAVMAAAGDAPAHWTRELLGRTTQTRRRRRLRSSAGAWSTRRRTPRASATRCSPTRVASASRSASS